MDATFISQLPSTHLPGSPPGEGDSDPQILALLQEAGVCCTQKVAGSS
jgi:hypothetical protein